MDDKIWKKKITYFLFGSLVVFSFLFLTGANDFQQIGDIKFQLLKEEVLWIST